MNKLKFLNYLNHPETISRPDLDKLEALAKQFPYSQVIHILVAKGRHNLSLDTFQSGLRKAALSANNRDLLKKLIEDVKVSNIVHPPHAIVKSASESLEENIQATEEAGSKSFEEAEPEVAKQPAISADKIKDDIEASFEVPNPEESDPKTEATEVSTSDQTGTTQKPEEIPVENAVEENGIHSELMANLEKLKLQRERLDQENQEESHEIEPGAEKAQEEKGTNDQPNSEPLAEEFDQPSIQTPETEDLVFDPPTIELADAFLEEEEKQASGQKSEESISDGIREEQKTQMDLIDSFIKNSPVLSKPNLSADSEATSQTDLSVKSAKFHQDFISENLATILAKQGKRKDAVGIYKKLMVKFPKKKAYFADQIDSLNKK